MYSKLLTYTLSSSICEWMKKKAKKIVEEKSVVMDDLISQTEAARIRGVTRAAIADLIRRGRLQTVAVAGRPLLRRADVLSYEPGVGGWPKGRSRKDGKESRKGE
jgi:hypothetical protein